MSSDTNPFPNYFSPPEAGSTPASVVPAAVGAERRIQTRWPMQYPATVEGYADKDSKFQEQTHLQDFSMGGVGLQLKHPVHVGDELSLLIRLSLSLERYLPVVCIEARGTIVHTAVTEDQSYQVGVQFQQYAVI